MSSEEISPLPSVSRRGFLAAGSASMVGGKSLREEVNRRAHHKTAVLQIFLNGGASHLETFDPKPHAPREIRGPLHSIPTKIPGVRFSECLPRLAERADHLVILRSLFHDAAPIHETGLQLLSTGRLVCKKVTPPHIGLVVQHLLGRNSRMPLSVELGGRIMATGTSAYRGNQAGVMMRDGLPVQLPGVEELLEAGFKVPDFSQAARRVRESYGETRFGQLFWTAARLLERGVRYVAVNSFDRLEGELTWDSHGCRQTGPATVFDYRDLLGPQLDRALAALLDDLQHTGQWDHTLLVCAGEMGRTPRLNHSGGRDHWTRAWSGLMAGGMLPGGRVIGETDEHGESILETPVPLSELPATILDVLGIPLGSEIVLQDGQTLMLPETAGVLSNA